MRLKAVTENILIADWKNIPDDLMMTSSDHDMRVDTPPSIEKPRKSVSFYNRRNKVMKLILFEVLITLNAKM